MSVDVTTCRCAEIDADVPIGILCVRCKAELTRLRDALEPTKANVDGLVGRGCLDRISALLAIATIRERAGLP
jgi:hypothetical protein